MFTGIITAKGRIRSLKEQGGDLRMVIESHGLRWSEFSIGESISVNGICLTIAALHNDGFEADVSAETMKVTTFAGLNTGSMLNLEPSIRLSDRLGGHLVSGHVDCVGTIRARDNDARSVRLKIELPKKYDRYLAKKGAICVDGVSLTINEVSEDTFEVNIISHTAEKTIIGDYSVGTVVNIEVDLVARYVECVLHNDRVPKTSGTGISRNFLKTHGYA